MSNQEPIDTTNRISMTTYYCDMCCKETDHPTAKCPKGHENLLEAITSPTDKAVEEIVEEFRKGFWWHRVPDKTRDMQEICDWLRTTLDRILREQRAAHNAALVEKIEVMQQETNYSTAYADWTPESAIREQARVEGYNQALSDITHTIQAQAEGGNK